MKLVEATAGKLLILAALWTSNRVACKEAPDLVYLAISLVSGDSELIFSKLGPDFDVNQPDITRGRTLLIWILAVIPFQDAEGVAQTTAVIKNILNRGVDLNQVDENGLTVLHYAAVYGTPEVLRMILEKGVKELDRQDINGNTALHLVQPVIGQGKSSIYEKAEVLMQYGANPNIKNNLGRTAIDELEINMKVEMTYLELKMTKIFDSTFST